ncbi:single-stranded DNA-binding protein [Bartonella raoultii]|uniref:Single-stranded DNA-binding protein n=1 Tax=Bartonella raoultii TaxID=1457020 RepID=A0ABS7I4G7_9HYPH|nr:single-stranded DNA-binding protein [Bartonella raoultii]MBX4335588.1 single-stranded DNA-binding protein [Bartonella raoultii]MBX4335674.1 single-stranded DNA-binding protein [Bartonella raoultii]MBX4336026.1 single-stranded DNA-binding protein [Bartonella raoultii]MBX4336379.1 single-stranded DNA-binding protein [Bartonella raoultii]MBX4336564.1 single-stranded DNA-binding protein [Bartonella raoultii]
MLNKVILIGYIGSHPESKIMSTGSEMVSFRLATTESYTDKASNKKIDKIEWHSIVIFNSQLVKIALQYFHKGSKVYLEGQLQTRKWQDKNGVDRYITEVILPKYKGDLKLLDSKNDDNQEQSSSYERSIYRPLDMPTVANDGVSF